MSGVPYKTVLDMRLHRLELRLDRSWWKSKLRTETPDGDRLEIKEMRRLRAVRLFFHLTALSEANQRRAEVAELVKRVEAKLQYSVICDYGSADVALRQLARLAGGGA